MKRVMLVDDEVLYRDFLAHLIDWPRYGLTLADMAEDGPQALRMMEAVPADIVVVDIIMPSMNGLELIAAIRSIHPETRLIALSGYDQYHLVSGAFRLSVSDYLLKTEITAAQLTHVLRTLIQRSVSSDLQSNSSVWCDDDLAPLFSRICEDTRSPSALIVRGSLDVPDGIEEIRLTSDILVCLSTAAAPLEALANLAAAARMPAILHHDADNLLSLIYADARLLSTEPWLDRDRVRIDIPSVFPPLIPDADARMNALENCIQDAAPLPASLLPADADCVDPRALGDLYRRLELRMRLLSEAAAPECQEYIAAFLSEYAGQRRVSVLNSCISDTLDALRTGSRVNYYVLQEIQRYIHEGYASNISLNNLARHLNLSDSYLSRAIADSTGKTFSQLLFEYRMEQARLKIESGETRVGELAASVGYASYESFSRAFKRAFRLSPQSYIRRHKRGDLP